MSVIQKTVLYQKKIIKRFHFFGMEFIMQSKKKYQSSRKHGCKPVLPLLSVGWSQMHYSLPQSDAMHAVADCVSLVGIATFWIIVSISYVMSYYNLLNLCTDCCGITTFTVSSMLRSKLQGLFNMISCNYSSCESCRFVTLENAWSALPVKIAISQYLGPTTYWSPEVQEGCFLLVPAVEWKCIHTENTCMCLVRVSNIHSGLILRCQGEVSFWVQVLSCSQ